MNKRMYDPAVGRLLSADPVVQDASNSQSYNRYSYCLNNPLKYTDPSGYTQAQMCTNEMTESMRAALGAWATALDYTVSNGIGSSSGDGFVGSSSSTPRLDKADKLNMAQDASGGWRYDEKTGTYNNIFSGENGWDNAFSSIQQSVKNLERLAIVQTAYSLDGGKTVIGNGDYYWVRLGHGVESTGLYPTFTSLQSVLDFINSFTGQNSNSGENRNFELGHNLFGDRYTGKNNPIGYSLRPLNPRDAISMEHDKGYDLFRAKGPLAVFTNGYVLPVDYKFVKEQYKLGFGELFIGFAQPNGTGGYFIQQGFYSILAGTGIGIPALLKTVFINPYRTY